MLFWFFCYLTRKIEIFFLTLVEYFSCWTHHSVNNKALFSFSFLLGFFPPLSCCRFEQPKCDGNARQNKPKDYYRSRHLQGELNSLLMSRCKNIVQGLLEGDLKLARGLLIETRLKKMKNNSFSPKRALRK